MKKFVLIGAAGYIAPRHMDAIKKTNNILVAAVDKHDSVGIIDSYFPTSSFFTEFERFDRHVEKMSLTDPIDYVSICSPNYLHDAHIRFGLRAGANVICEKPLVINPRNLDSLEKIEEKSEGNVNCILQLRLSEAFKKIKEKVDNADDVLDIDVTYITSRGQWYTYSWKGDEQKSGGVIYNIGIHLIDMLCYALGEPVTNTVHISESRKAAGYLEFKKARVRWFLSIQNSDMPEDIKDSTMYRSITINGEAIDMSFGFQDLHVKAYKKILDGQGFRMSDARTALQVAYDMKNSIPIGIKGDFHPLLLDSKFK